MRRKLPFRTAWALPKKRLRRPVLRIAPAQLLDMLVAGDIWAWCCEGWVVPRYDIQRAAQR